MAVIRDVMPAFELFQPTSVAEAADVLGRYGAQGWVLAGGLDSFDWLKDRIKRPSAVIDLSGVAELRGIREVDGGLEIGAMTTLTDLATHPVVRRDFAILPQAAEAAASPQIRNQGTVGGNLMQDTRCWYYRSGWSCYRAGGNICYADTPEAINREHAILEADRCVAVTPSDTAPAFVALEATMVVWRDGTTREVPAEDFFVGPGYDITRMTSLRSDDLLTAIRVPATWAGAEFYFEKVRDRNVWDFPLVNVASALRMGGGAIDAIRLASGGVAARPLRLARAEAAAAGRPRDAATALAAGERAIEGAVPLAHNAYKVPLLRNLVKRAILGVQDV
jgi:xanthine dehydrogenase YagS FAD-binding subunit